MTDQMPPQQTEAYGRVQRAALLPRQVEATAFAKAAALLDEAGARVRDFAAYRAALRFNRLVWTLVQADLVRPDNGLSEPLKARLLSLSLYVDKQTVAALAAPAAARLAPLIEIDRCLAQGLLGTAERGAAPEGGEGRAATPAATAAVAPARRVLSA
jgi:flagellar protein FlaF